MNDDRDTPEYKEGEHSALVIGVAMAIARGQRESTGSGSSADRLEEFRESTRSMLLQAMPEGFTPRQIALTTAGFDSCFGQIARVVRAITEEAPDV